MVSKIVLVVSSACSNYVQYHAKALLHEIATQHGCIAAVVVAENPLMGKLWFFRTMYVQYVRTCKVRS